MSLKKKLEQDFVGAEGQHGIGKQVQFLKSHFQYDTHSTSENDLHRSESNAPYYTPHNLNEYNRLIDLYELIYDTKRDIAKINREVVQIEKHVVWAMYYNWRDEEIESAANSTSAPSRSLREL